MRKKVLFIITKATWGGAQRYVYDVAVNLPKHEFEPIVACGKLGKLANDLIHAGIIGRHLPSLNRDIGIISDIKSFSEIREVIQEIRPDVVHLNSSKAAAIGAITARMEKVPTIIFTVHGWPFKEKRNLVTRFFIYLASWLTALLSHRVIVVSKEDERLGKRMWGVARKIHYIGLGIAPTKTTSPAEGFAGMFGTNTSARVEGSTLRLVTIAELTKNKSVLTAIQALSELARRGIDAVYVVAGEGEERTKLESQARNLGVADRVFFSGFVANASQYLSGFDVFVLPSIKEGTPYVLLEAARAGIPIVATQAIDASLAQEIKNMRIVAPQDPDALADAIVQAAKTPRSGDKRENLFDLSSMILEHTKLYRL
jgi:glycosyltransferase involved in cell wall biosynthesis